MYDPHGGGAVLPMYSPSTHRLYVNYCKKCIGVMDVVREWNADVERAVYMLSQGERMQAEIVSLQKVLLLLMMWY